jgi:hypothetical protein
MSTRPFDLVRARRPAAVLSESTAGDLARSARWDELLRPGGRVMSCACPLVADGYWCGPLSLYREKRTRPFTSGDAAVLADLAGPIARTARAAWTASEPDRGPCD